MVAHLGDDVVDAVSPELSRCRLNLTSRVTRPWTNEVDESSRLLASHGAALRELDAAVAQSAGTVALINLDQVAVSQSVVAVDDVRVSALLTDHSLEQLIDVCVPLRPTSPPIVGYDNRAQTWIVRSSDASIEIVGRYAGPVGEVAEGTQLFGFIVQASPSRITVRRTGGRLVLVDGHHRALALWIAGVLEVPAVVYDGSLVDNIESGQLPSAVVLDERAPRLGDYLNDEVSVECRVARSESMTVVGAQRLQVPGR